MKIVILDGYALNPGDLSWKGIEALGEVKLYERTSAGDVVSRCQGAEIVLTNKVPFSAETLSQLPDLRMIGVMATGYNIIDCKAASDHGVTVCNIPAYSTTSVAQQVFALLFAATNSVEHYTRQIRQEGRWTSNPDFCYWDTPLQEMAGKTFGIVGLGRIGMQVAGIANAFGMRVIAMTSKGQDELPLYINKVDEQRLLADSDVLSLHCPLTPATQDFINAKRLSKMRPTAIIINTSRGPVVNEADIAEALQQNRLGAFCADVLCQEPASASNPLLSAPRVFLTPHIAWATFEARTRLMEILTENVSMFIEGKPQNVVNPPKN